LCFAEDIPLRSLLSRTILHPLFFFSFLWQTDTFAAKTYGQMSLVLSTEVAAEERSFLACFCRAARNPISDPFGKYYLSALNDAPKQSCTFFSAEKGRGKRRNVSTTLPLLLAVVLSSSDFTARPANERSACRACPFIMI